MSYKNIIAQKIFFDTPFLLRRAFRLFKILFLSFISFWDILTQIDLFPFILNEEFKTIKDYYKEEKSEFTEKEKEECEEHINKIINRTIQFRTKKKKNS